MSHGRHILVSRSPSAPGPARFGATLGAACLACAVALAPVRSWASEDAGTPDEAASTSEAAEQITTEQITAAPASSTTPADPAATSPSGEAKAPVGGAWIGSSDGQEGGLFIPLLLSYRFENRIGSSTFVGRGSWVQRLGLSLVWLATANEFIAASWGFNAEFFTSTNGSHDHVLLEDLSLAASTNRWVGMQVSDHVFLGISPSIRARLPTSKVSINAAPHYGSYSVGASADVSFRGFTFSVSPGLGYTFFTKTQIDLPGENAQFDGTLNAPLDLSLGLSVSYGIAGFWTGASYSLARSLTYPSNGGVSSWRQFNRFSLSAGYNFHPMLRLALAYTYGADPQDAMGTARFPFWSAFADYHNQSRIVLSVSGAYLLGQSL